MPGCSPAHRNPQECVPGCHMLPFLQDRDKLGEPVPLHLGSLPEGLELCHLCLPAFLFWGVREPGDQGQGQRSLEELPEDIITTVMMQRTGRTCRVPRGRQTEGSDPIPPSPPGVSLLASPQPIIQGLQKSLDLPYWLHSQTHHYDSCISASVHLIPVGPAIRLVAMEVGSWRPGVPWVPVWPGTWPLCPVPGGPGL